MLVLILISRYMIEEIRWKYEEMIVCAGLW
jgi:hypothetical protein